MLLLFAIILVSILLVAGFARAVEARRDREAADQELHVLLVEAAAKLDLAEATARVALHKAWFKAFAAEARFGRPLRSARSLAEWTRAVSTGRAMALGTAAEKHAEVALGIAGEIAAHRCAPRGIR